MIARTNYYMPYSLWNLTPSSTPTSSPSSSVVFGEGQAMNSRPLSLSIPSGNFSAARPTLDEVLSNTAPFPYTLSAFMAYLSQNHCLETLEFTLEAKRYGETYRSVARVLGQPVIVSDTPQTQHLLMLWQRLLSAYIVPGAPREINLSSQVRDNLLADARATRPPPPQTLDAAIRRMHDLMEESIFIHFVNSNSSPANIPTSMDSSYVDDHPHFLRRVASRGKRVSPRASRDDVESHRMSGSTRIAAIVKTGSHLSGHSSGMDTGSPIFTDDSGSLASSPVAGEPMTPPTTPPSSDHSFSPKNRPDNTWKKMGMKLGFKKKHGTSSSRDGRWEE
ncbi:regulator of G protein signaling domain protein RgsD [Talaromyces proteolyticus]|uniref:Regulator of G protein signaling domain protein RgsD n=1 Tax=Talaromyces proteolyticus TaxID=1131652 RepID=A0AAD4KQL3_9EURO|nr:regulator of G protein signaling domain protein RgsD [Talaromyces proteolyticus]KAH8697174.1 regulator of G protein signaling domain protein RgsD [Talaromyces proteolyticus]